MATVNNTPHIGTVEIGRTVYQVYSLSVGPNSAKMGVKGHYALVGPRGAGYMVTDHGPQYQPVSFAVGTDQRRCSPRPLRGLTSRHVQEMALLRTAVTIPRVESA